MSDAARVVLANSACFINLIIYVSSSVFKEKRDIILLNTIPLIMDILAYLVSGLYGAVIVIIFATVRNASTLIFKSKFGSILKGLCILMGTALSVYSVIKSGDGWTDYIPAVSFLWFSLGQEISKNANQLRFVSSVDALMLIYFDFTNMIVVNVIVDLFRMLLPVFVKYVQRDTTDEIEEAPVNTEVSETA